ncbi:MAG: MFS transporter, partial [Stackebrandtia sp.]
MSPRHARLPRAFWFIWTSLLISKAGGFVVIIMTLYLTSKQGLTESRAGLIVGMFGLGGAAGVLVGGVCADRLGRKPTMVIAAAAAAASLGTLANLTEPLVIGVFVAAYGFASAAFGPSAIAAIADVVRPEERDRAFNLMFWAINLGMGAAALLAGFLAQFSFALLFWLDAGATAITGVMILLAVPETLRSKRSGSVSLPASRGRFIDVWRDGVYMTFVSLVFLQSFVWAQAQTTLPLAMTGDGLSESDYGVVLAIGSAMIIGGQLVIPKLTTRFSKATALSMALAFFAIGFGSVGLVAGFTGYVVCAVIWTIGNMMAAPPNATVIADLSPEHMRGRYQGVFSLTHSVANFAAPAIG